MAVTSVNQNGDNKPAQEGTPNAAPALKLTDLFQKFSSQGGWTGDAHEYLQAIRKQLEDPSMPVHAKMQYIADDAVAFTTEDNSSVVLVRENDLVNVQALTADAKLYNAREAFYNNFPNNKLVCIATCNRFMFNRAGQMAAYISQSLLAQKDEQIGNFTIDSFGSRYHVHIDTEMSNVRQFFDAHSPNPTICGTFGFIASLVDKDDTRHANFQATTQMFGVTGYVEFHRNETTGFFTPIVHVTDILSVLASTKILALALPLIGEIFIGRHLWRQPFTVIGKDAGINIGNLIVDATNQQPYEVKTEIDFRKLFREYISAPILCIDVRAGHTNIPGLNKITRPSDHEVLINDMFKFLNVNPMITEGLGQNIYKEIVGVFETSKSTQFTNLMDTRDVTYLYAVSKLKWSPKLEYLLTRSDIDPVRRFDMIRDIIGGEIVPTHSSITTLLYGNLIKQVAAIVSSKVSFIMPMSTDLPAIDLNAFIDKSYQPGISMLGQGTPSALNGVGFIRGF